MSVDQLPAGWRRGPLRSVADIERDSISPESIRSGTTYVGLEHLTAEGSFSSPGPVNPGELRSSKFRFTREHILYGKLRPYLKKIATPDFEGICSTDILPIRPKQGMERSYLRYFLRQPEVVGLAARRSSGVNLPRISPKILEEFPITYPADPQEQKRIAAILDEADAIRRKREQAIGLTEDLLRSTFLEIFGDPLENPRGWPVSDLAASCTVVDGTHKTPKYVSEGVVFISAKNVRDREISWDDVKYITLAEHEELRRRCKPERGDIVLTKSGSLGEAALIDVEFEFSLFESLALLKFDTEVFLPEYLLGFLNSDAAKTMYLRFTKGVAVRHLHLVDIRKLQVPIPPVAAQRDYCVAVGKIRSVLQKQRHAKSLTSDLFGSLAQRAFRGEL